MAERRDAYEQLIFYMSELTGDLTVSDEARKLLAARVVLATERLAAEGKSQGSAAVQLAKDNLGRWVQKSVRQPSPPQPTRPPRMPPGWDALPGRPARHPTSPTSRHLDAQDLEQELRELCPGFWPFC